MATQPRLKTDSPLSRRIVTAFLDFLNNVEPAPGVDHEGLEVAKECLADVFKVDPLALVDSGESPDLLVSLFGSGGATSQLERNLDVIHAKMSADAASTSSAQAAYYANLPEALRIPGDEWMGEVPAFGSSEDELFGQFFGALERIHYFKRTSDGHDDQDQLDRATQLFYVAVLELRKSGRQMVNAKDLAETFKSQGNKAMQSKKYSEAIELYTYAIALCEDNAVYYCNRAAAYTQTRQYGAATSDSLRSVEIDPNYGKAYSRLGFAYYAQGNFRDAIDKGFMKALELDPNNDSVKENIRVAEQKLREQQQRNGHEQNSRSGNQRTNQQGGSMPPPFTSMPFNANGLPTDFANMFANLGSNIRQGPYTQDGQRTPSAADMSSEPEVRVGGGSVSINLGDQMPEDLSGALRSVMQMFSGSAPPPNRQDNTNGGSAPS